MSQLLKLSLETINQFDFGKVTHLFATLAEAAVRDCMNRSGEKKPRKVQLEFFMKPMVLSDGTAEEVSLKVTGKVALPAYSTPDRPLRMTTQGGLLFNADSPADPDQKTVFDNEDD